MRARGKIKELTRLRAEVTLEYDGGVPEDAQKALARVFCAREHRAITKRSKKGDEAELDHQAADFRAVHRRR